MKPAIPDTAARQHSGGPSPIPGRGGNRNDRARKPDPSDVEAEIAGILDRSTQELRLAWRKLHRTEPPFGISRDLLIRALVHQLQEQSYGGTGRALRRRLQTLTGEREKRGASFDPAAALKTGTTLVRQWRGHTHAGPAALKLRNLMKGQSQRFPKPKKLNARETAAAGGVEMAYQEYGRLSLDAVHCSVTALGYHLSSEHNPGKSELVLSVVPRAPPGGAVSTVLHACRALIPTARGADELIGCTTAGATLAAPGRSGLRPALAECYR